MHGVFRNVKATKRTTGPVRMIVAVPETPVKLECVEEGECYYSARAVWSMYSRRYGDRWVGDVNPTRRYPDDFWQWVCEICKHNTAVWVVSPNGGDLCTLTAFWHWVDRGVFSISADRDNSISRSNGDSVRNGTWQGRLVLGGPPDIIHVRYKRGSVRIVSLRNYTEASWERLCSTVGCKIDGIGDTQHRPSDADIDPFDRCAIASAYMRSLISGWIKQKCGGWKDTVASLSVSWWRNSFYTTKVTRHDNAEAIALERAAAYGGRNEVWFYGDCGDASSLPDGIDPPPKPSQYPPIRDAIYHCDISAQYPAILADKEFPIRLKGIRDNPSVADLSALLRYYGAIAHVRIRASEPEYPCKKSGEATYPCGVFDTTLAGPELACATSDGSVIQCYRVAYYELGYPLRAYAQHLLSLRQQSKERGDYCGELFAKCLATAIGGKFSQRTKRREARGEFVNPFGRWGPYTTIDTTGNTRRLVSIAGMSFEDVEIVSGGKLLAAVYCYLTSYGRCQMRRIRDSLLPAVPYSQCTDGIWIGQAGKDRLDRMGLTCDRIPGTLRLVREARYARWITPNHYYVDGKWTLAGYRHGGKVNPDLTVTEYRDINTVRGIPYKPPMALKRKAIKRNLVELQPIRLIGPDGWLLPPTRKG